MINPLNLFIYKDMKNTPQKNLFSPERLALMGIGTVIVGGTIYYYWNKKPATPLINTTGSSVISELIGGVNKLKTSTPTLLTLTANSVSYSGVSLGSVIYLFANGTYANVSKIADTSGTWTGLTLVNGVSYYITTKESNRDESNTSNAITFSSSGTGGGNGTPIDTSNVSSFINIMKTIPQITANGIYNPQLFPIIGVVNSIDPKISSTKEYPNWVIAWQCEGGNFKNNQRTTVQLGIPFMYDRNPLYYNGYGERGLDYIYDLNPNNGCAWGQERVNGQCQGNITNVDAVTGQNWNTFVSRIPFHERAYATFGLAGDENRIRWDNASLEQCFDDGLSAASSNQYGHGDTVGGKVNTGLCNADIEINYELGESGTNKHAAFMMGMASRSQGLVFSQYSGAFQPTSISPHFYPDSNGNFPSTRLNIDRSVKFENNQPITNAVPQSSDWNPNNRFSISGRGISDKSLLDYQNALMCVEVSSLASEAFRQGEIYDKTGNGNMVTVNKYGLNANTQHIIAFVRHMAEINKWWSVNKLGNRRVMMQTKITCDRANLGIFFDAGFTNTALQFHHHSRRYAHMMGGLTAFNGCEWNVWDRNTNKNLDGYHGALGVINLLKQKKDFGNGVHESFETLKPRMNFLLWDSEISYDNGLTWKKETSDSYVFNPDSIIQSQGLTPDGYWGGYLLRSEGGEKTNCKLRVNYNGTTFYYTVTADMWESTSKTHENTPLANIPNSDKDYHYFLVKL